MANQTIDKIFISEKQNYIKYELSDRCKKRFQTTLNIIL